MTTSLKNLLAQERLLRVCLLGQFVFSQAGRDDRLARRFRRRLVRSGARRPDHPADRGSRRAARACGIASFVRLNATDYATVMRPLEAGAGGIMASMVRSASKPRRSFAGPKFHLAAAGASTAAASITAMAFTRLGPISSGPTPRPWCCIQIEHQDAVDGDRGHRGHR